ncbi:MAG: hypothetical protein WAV95_11055 [Azonexus sp.]
MSSIDPQQVTSIARLLATSRSYFGLPERRRLARPPHNHLRWLRLALLAGGIGSLFGSPAMAENNTRAARQPGGSTQVEALAAPTRRSIEQMP